jgi:hypothetical protein
MSNLIIKAKKFVERVGGKRWGRTLVPAVSFPPDYGLANGSSGVEELKMGEFEVTEEEIQLVGPILRRLLWSNQDSRRKIQELGVTVIPADFYSNTPSIDDITTSYEYTNAEPPYLAESIFDNESMKRTLGELAVYASEFAPPFAGDENNPEHFFWDNNVFSFSDALSYYCFIRMVKPKTILEIGSGFSTLVAIEAVRKNQHGKIVCIEPFPKSFLETNPVIELVRRKAQDIDPDFLNNLLADGDILFIDSTHTVKTGSDCLHIYLRLLPQIKRNIHVHVHDVFLPFGLPVSWLLDKQIFWTEQYLLLAFLIDNPKASVCYGSMYHSAFNPEALEKMMLNKTLFGGSSFWFEYRGGTDPRA